MHFRWHYECHQELVVNREKQRVLSSVISHLRAEWPRLLTAPANALISRLVSIRREGLVEVKWGIKPQGCLIGNLCMSVLSAKSHRSISGRGPHRRLITLPSACYPDLTLCSKCIVYKSIRQIGPTSQIYILLTSPRRRELLLIVAWEMSPPGAGTDVDP